MRFRHLKYILKVAEVGSITKAANELYISQPSLTKAIYNLEKEYNIKIFERNPTGVIVTPEGKHFLHYAKNIVCSITSLNEVFKNHSYVDQNKLSVATQQLDFIPEVTVNLYNTYSDTPLELDFYTTHRSNVIKAVQKGDSNIGLLVQTNLEAKAFDWQINCTNLELRTLDSSDIYGLLGPKSSLYNAQSLTFEDVKKSPHICLDIDELTRSEWNVNNQNLYINTNNIIYCNSIPICIELLEKTDMVLYAPKWILKYFIDTNIRILPISNNDTYTSNLVYIKRKNESLTPIETQFLEEVKKSLKV